MPLDFLLNKLSNFFFSAVFLCSRQGLYLVSIQQRRRLQGLDVVQRIGFLVTEQEVTIPN